MKKKIIITVFVFIVVVMLSAVKPNNYKEAHAETVDPVILAREMTKDDQLEGGEVNITQFSQKVLESDELVKLYDFPKVVPNDYLIPTGETTCYYYFGKEYGFYIRHREVIPRNPNIPEEDWSAADAVSVIDILLLDFKYKDLDTYAKYDIKVIILFSESFYYGCDDKGVFLRRITMPVSCGYIETQEYREKLAIVNPQFATMILNENALNYGDPGYDKAADDGLVIVESRTNYSGSVVKCRDEAEIAAFLIRKAVTYGMMIGNASAMATMINEVIDWTAFFMSVTEQEVEIEKNNEDNIILNEPKDVQRSSSNPSYLRGMVVAPKDDIKMQQEGSYVQNIIILNGCNATTRMSRFFGFSILSCPLDRSVDKFEYLNERNDKGEMIPFVVKNENQILHEEETPVEVRSDTQESLYILPGGKQTYVFQPYSSGKFLITVPFRAWFSVTDHATGEEIQFSLVPDRTTEKSRSYTAELNKQTEYLLTVNGNEQIIDHIRITFNPKKLPRKQSIVSFKDEKEKYFALDAVDSYYYLTKSDASLNMQLLDENLNLIASLDNSYEFYAENKVRYLFLFYAHENTSNVKMELWERKRISFYGSGVDEPQWIVNTDLSFILPTPSREGYIFEGWYFNSRYDGEKATPESVCAYAGPDVNLYAQWKIDSKKIYQINYVIPDTVYDDKNEIIDTSLIEFQNRIDSFKVTDEVILPILNSEAYNFMGWYTDSDFKNKITKIPQGTIGNKTLYAKIELKEFIISFDLNGGSGDVASQHVKYGKEIQLPTVSRAGYAGNWNAWNGEKSNFGYGYTVYKTETLRAVWRKIYNITYHNVNSRGIVYLHYEKEDAYLRQYYFSDINFDLSRIDVRVPGEDRPKHLRFVGWYTNSELSDPIARIQKGRTGNINLYAKWAFSVSETHTKEQRVTDADHFSQVTDNNLFYLGRMAEMYQSDLKAFGLKKFRFTVSFDMKEENNGNQFMFVFNSKYKEYAKCFYYKGYEYGGVRIDKTYSHVSESFEMSITEFDNDFYVLFGANGAGADDWYYKNLTLKIESIE